MTILNTTYKIDSNHTGIRLAVLAVIFGGFTLGTFVIMPAILKALDLSGSEYCFTIVGGSAIGVGGGWALERLLKRIWPSGRLLELNEESITLYERSGESIPLRRDNRINVLSWFFVIRKGRTVVPRGWYCAACRLTQDEQVITLYTFIKPDVAETLPQWPAFEELLSKKHAPRRGEEHELKKIPEQKQLRLAEEDRWRDGAEMRPEDFVALIQDLDTRLPEWPQEADS